MATRRVTQSRRSKATKEVSVLGWIENQFGEVLLLKQKRGRQSWTLPGGKVCAREALKTALRREVLEETGLKVDGLVLRCVFDRPRKDSISFLYSVRIKGRSDELKLRDREIAAARFSSSLAKNATPSLQYFWRFMRAATKGD